MIAKLADLDAGSYAGALRNPRGFILAAGKQAEGPDHAWKLAMPEDLGEERVMKRLLSQFDVILIEADGAKRLPLKVPSDTGTGFDSADRADHSLCGADSRWKALRRQLLPVRVPWRLAS